MRDEQCHFYSPYHCKNFKNFKHRPTFHTRLSWYRHIYNYIKIIQNVK